MDHGPAQAIFRLVRAVTDASVCTESTSPHATTGAQSGSVQSARSSSVEHSTPRLLDELVDDLSISSSGSELSDSDDDNRKSASEQGGASSTTSSGPPSTVAGASESTYGSSAKVGPAVAAVPEDDSDAGSTLPLGQSGSRTRQRRVTFSDMPVVSDAPALSASSTIASMTIDSKGQAAQVPTRRRSTHAKSVRLSIQLAPPPSRGGQTAVRPAAAPSDAQQISQPATAAVPGKIPDSGDHKPSNEHPGAVTTSRRRSGRAGSRPRNLISLVAPLQHRSFEKSPPRQRTTRDSEPAENSQVQSYADSDGITTVRSPPLPRLDTHVGRRRRDHGTAGQPDRKRLAISLVPPKR